VSHLSDIELRRWRDHGNPGDRGRVVAHLAECDACGAAYAELVRAHGVQGDPAAEAGGPADVPDAGEFRRAGYAAGRTPAFPFTRLAAAAGLAAAAAGVGAVLLRAPSETPPRLRGSELVAVAPAGEVRWPVEFRWSSPLSAPAYRVDVFDTSGRRVHSIPAMGETAADPGLRERLQPGGRYTFVVTALGADGRELLSSAPRAFVYAPGG
jgi:hypothetical protein